ncbi:MAG: hypothetical protein JWM80_2921, partial [Cyanobacteria bacterium RYN_339]|nr:hypothetical protein [Cyanobacteria bacterium RYN_339]
MRGWMILLTTLALVGCQPAGGGGGGTGHARSFQGDVDACFHAAGRAEAALAKG